MKNLNLVMSLLFISTTALSQSYKAPPTSSTSGYVPVISDELMEQCVRIYNEADWLQNDLSQTSVNQYSQYEVNQYNQNIAKLNQLTNWFNQNCAGKQSRSACETAKKLNQQAGLSHQSCY
ncbi:hypothetical protein B0187_02580 [Haemophilus paracuniculus]|uniref:Stress protein, tellurium resistance protein TerZ n=1 Tax=Haemophilus paracuniculus TaxID=734 RepID=A0A1T0AT30_9PAST|nr:hypothetical protein [Haemophilus paracuniculus]OOR99714.1 hypothetical protein B0187_02580 [Haemophilus paracuniculus]